MAHVRSQDLSSSDQGTLDTVKQANTNKTLEKKNNSLQREKHNGLSIVLYIIYHNAIENSKYFSLTFSFRRATTIYRTRRNF